MCAHSSTKKEKIKRKKNNNSVSQRHTYEPPVFVGRIGTLVNRSAFSYLININIFFLFDTDFFFFLCHRSGVLCKPRAEVDMRSKTSDINAALHYICDVEIKFLSLNFLILQNAFFTSCRLGARVFCGHLLNS